MFSPARLTREMNLGVRVFWEGKIKRAQNYSQMFIIKSLAQGDRTRLCRLFVVACFF
jgi:hypothetical protein